MQLGVIYEVHGSHSDDIETFYNVDPFYTALKRPGELEAFEQRAEGDQSSPFLVTNEETSVLVYKLDKEFPLFDLIDYASKLNGLNEGIRKFSTADANAPFWVDISNGGESLSSEQQQWYNDIVTDLNSVPHVYLSLPFEQDPTEPAGPHVRVNIDEDNPGTPSNSTDFNEDHEIQQARATYQDSPSRYYFTMEVLQAIGDLNDVGGSPNILNGPEQDYTLNSTGRDIFSVMYLYQPGTKF